MTEPAAIMPPHDLDSEGVVLSAIMLSPDSFDRVESYLRPEHFYADANRRIYEAITDLHSAGIPGDVEAIAGWLRDRERLSQVGGTPYLARLCDSTPAVAHVEHYARQVVEKSRIRRIIAEAQAIAAEGYASPRNVDEFVQGAESRLYACSQDAVRTVTTQTAHEIMAGCLAEISRRLNGEAPRGLASGFGALDRRVGHFRPGRVYVAAGRPGMGKTSFATQVMARVCAGSDPRRGCMFFSLEMPREQIGDRLLAQECLLDTRQVEQAMLNPPEWSAVASMAETIGAWPLIVDDRAAITVPEMRSVIRRAKRRLETEHPGVQLGLVAVDYFQLLGTRDLPRGLNGNDIGEHLMKGLVGIAKEFDVPVIVLSQLNRECEKRGDKRPQLSDLRSSGAIEQDAHTVIFLYRDDVYKGKDEPRDRSAEFIVAKARSGQTGTVAMRFLDYCTRYEDAAETELEGEIGDYASATMASGF